MDRGQVDDWFGSLGYHRKATAVSALGFALLIPWEISRRDRR